MCVVILSSRFHLHVTAVQLELLPTNTDPHRHSAHLFVPTADIQTSSPEPKTYVQKGDSGNEMTRAWCDACGSGIWMRSASKPDMTFMKAGPCAFCHALKR